MIKDYELEITPVEKIGNIWVKRNDLYELAGCKGGKVASAYKLILDAKEKGYDTVVTTGSRQSPQCEIVSCLCEMENMKCHLLMPSGEDTKVLRTIYNNKNSTLHRYTKRCALQVNLNKYAKKMAEENNWYLIPFGMQCTKNVDLVAKQVVNIPKEVKRIVVPVGSGMTFCGVMKGLVDCKRLDIELVGVVTGGNPEKIISIFRPKFVELPKWRLEVFHPEFKRGKDRYALRAQASIGDIELDEVYEAKCMEFIQDGDLFWIVGKHEL